MKSKNEFNKIDIQNRVCFYFNDIINGTKINFSNILLKVKILQVKRSGITKTVNYNFGKIKIDSYNSLSIKKILIFHTVIMIIKSVINKNENKYYYNLFLEKRLYKCKSSKQYF